MKKSEKKIFNQYSSTRIEKNTMIVVDKKVYVIGELVALHPVTVLTLNFPSELENLQSMFIYLQEVSIKTMN